MPTCPPAFLRASAHARCAAAAVALCGPAGAGALPVDVSVTDSAGRPLADAIVSIVLRGQPSTAPAGTKVEIAQDHRKFEPPITVIQTGTGVVFPNFDTVRHQVYSFSPIKRFELKLYAGIPGYAVVFDKPGTATLGCSIHDKMRAWVHVVDTPVYGRTDAAGKVHLDVPEGDHQLQAWHFRQAEGDAPLVQPLHVAGAGARAAIPLVVNDAPQ